MNNIEANIKKWIESIQTENLKGITEDIQIHIPTKPNGKINKQIFKLLLYLSHTADKCNKKNYTVGKEIYKLTCLLCSTLTEIPDSIKFVSSLFHIIRCLLAMFMYEEASKVCTYLKLESLSHFHANVSEILVKITHLWYNSVNRVYLSLQTDLSNFECYHELKTIILYEIETIQIVHKSYTKHVLMKISSYIDKFALLERQPNTFFNDFYKFILDYLSQSKMFLNEDDKYVIYRHILQIISTTICKYVNDNNSYGLENLNRMCSYFKKIISQDDECSLCFEQFESMCITFMKSIECVEGGNTRSVQDINEHYMKLTKQYGYAGCIKWTTLSSVQVLQTLLMYWETCIKEGRKMSLDDNLLLETMRLVKHLSIYFVNQILKKCKSCKDADCTITSDIYNAVVIKTRCVNIVCKLFTNDLPKDICTLARKFMEQNVAHIYEMKQCKCRCWMHLWSNTAALIYNLGITSERLYEESTTLFCLLLTSIIQFEGIIHQSQYISLQNPICSTLHRLSNIHYIHGMYREAMTVSALNGLLSYRDLDSKAFRMWANIKHKCVTSKKIMEMTMLDCLRADKVKIEELGMLIKFFEYDLVQMCLREIKGLHAAKVNLSCAIQNVLKELTALKVTPVQYAHAVLLLACHLLNFEHDEDISRYLKKAISDIKSAKRNAQLLCLEANLEFFIFVSELHAGNRQTRIEMESTKFALYATKLSKIGENDSRDVVPTYTLINVKENRRLMMILQKSLNKWNECFKQNLVDASKEGELEITLHILRIAGEYCRLYRYEECEFNVWKLAHKLALELQNYEMIIYITGRSISLRRINEKWITIAKELTVKMKDTNDENVIFAIATFWISLSDFYFECDMYDEGRMLLDETRKFPEISFLSNIAVYLYRLDKILLNYCLYQKDIEHQEYIKHLVEILYSLVNLNEELTMRKWKPQHRYLFSYDVLFSTTVNLSLRMNSLLSFREIGSHLVRRLRVAQSLGVTIRVAEMLKSLCYIDLSRSQLSDCEVKLQGLEHILNIETFQLSMNTNLLKSKSENIMTSPTRFIDPVRDILQNDASPVLRNEVFDLPEFLSHTNCTCYACQNVSYRYLVFASTHIRAQLYSLQNRSVPALQHFQGAFQIKEKLRNTENQSKTSLEKYKGKQVSCQDRFYIIDYVLLLLNFYYFLKCNIKPSTVNPLEILLLALRICKMYKLEGHPIYMSVKELMLDNRFQKVFSSLDYSTFTVPASSEIDVTNYVHHQEVEQNICSTPTTNAIRKNKPVTLRRNRTPPLLKLTKVDMNFSDDEDNTALSPPPVQKRIRSQGTLTRRKILDDDYSDNTSIKSQDTIQSKSKLPVKMARNAKKQITKNVSVKDIVDKIAPLVPEVSEQLYKWPEKLNTPATNESVQTFIEMLENLKIDANVQTNETNVRKTRHSKRTASNDRNKSINQVVELFKDMALNTTRHNSSSTIKNNSVSEYTSESMSSQTDVIQKQSLIAHKNVNTENTIGKLSEDILSSNQCTTDNFKKMLVNETVIERPRRTAAKRIVSNKETQTMRNRKSKEKSLQ